MKHCCYFGNSSTICHKCRPPEKNGNFFSFSSNKYFFHLHGSPTLNAETRKKNCNQKCQWLLLLDKYSLRKHRPIEPNCGGDFAQLTQYITATWAPFEHIGKNVTMATTQQPNSSIIIIKMPFWISYFGFHQEQINQTNLMGKCSHCWFGALLGVEKMEKNFRIMILWMGHLFGVSQKPIAFEWHASSLTIQNETKVSFLSAVLVWECSSFGRCHTSYIKQWRELGRADSAYVMQVFVCDVVWWSWYFPMCLWTKRIDNKQPVTYTTMHTIISVETISFPCILSECICFCSNSIDMHTVYTKYWPSSRILISTHKFSTFDSDYKYYALSNSATVAVLCDASILYSFAYSKYMGTFFDLWRWMPWHSAYVETIQIYVLFAFDLLNKTVHLVNTESPTRALCLMKIHRIMLHFITVAASHRVMNHF